jgi:guanylate kinase
MSSKLLGNLKKGLPFVISAPAGTGKTTLVQLLVEEFPCVTASVSYTTRPRRKGEIPGEHYNFLTVEEFERKIATGDFLEYVKLYGHYYGTSRPWVNHQLELGKHVILTIDTQGMMILKNQFPAVFIFLQPPSLEELQIRLQQRNTEGSEEISERLEIARKEIEMSRFYDYNIVNDDLSTAYQVLRSILIAEEHRLINLMRS